MSDLQCPVRLFLLSGPDAAVADRLRHERVAMVYDGPPRASGASTALAEALGVPLGVLSNPVTLDDVRSGSGDTMAVLRDVADLHRGEAVVVVVAGAKDEIVQMSLDADGTAP
jgi:hypothetical protein